MATVLGSSSAMSTTGFDSLGMAAKAPGAKTVEGREFIAIRDQRTATGQAP